jgi:PAS domain S-box-containing protein
MNSEKNKSHDEISDNSVWAKYKPILDILTIPIIILDELGNIKHFNNSVHLLLGFDKKEMGLSLPISDLLNEKDDSAARIMDKIKSSKPGSVLTKILTKQGIYVPVELSLTPLADPVASTNIFIVQITDIRSHIELEQKESLLSAALNSSLDGMAILDRGLKIRLINSSFAEMLGTTKENLSGVNIFEIPHQALSEMEKKNFLYVLKQSGIWRGVITTGLKNNQPRQIEIGIYRIKAEHEERDAGFIAISRDVTTAEVQNDRIRTLSLQLKEYSKQIIKAMSGTTIESSIKNICTEMANISEFEDIRIILFSTKKPYYEIYYSNSDTVKTHEPLFNYENHPQSIAKQIKTYKRIGTKIYVQEKIIQDSDNDNTKNRLWILLTNEYDKPVGCITLISPNRLFEEQIISLDVFSVQFSLFLQIINLQKTLNNSRKEMEDFIYSISHDLKTPVMAIVGFSEILSQKADTKLNSEEIHCLNRIEANVTLINNMVNSLLELSRAGRKMTEEDKKLSVKEVIESVQKKVEEKFKMQLPLTVAPNLPFVEYDVKGMSAIFYNLIENAVKFQKKTDPLEIQIGLIDRKENYVFYVKDNGIGIPAKGRERIFEPFFRLCSKDTEGIGIGLSIAQRIVEARGGEIWFESKEGDGSTFYFSINRK